MTKVGPTDVRGHSGFTLLELMVTVAVLSILISIAVPSFSAMITRNRLRAASSDLLTGYQVARSEAIKRNRQVRLCATTNGTTCDVAPTASWERWIALSSTGQVLQEGRIPRPLVSASNFKGTNVIRIRPDGFSYSDGADPYLLQGTVIICAPGSSVDKNLRRLVLESGVRFQVQAAHGAATCDELRTSA